MPDHTPSLTPSRLRLRALHLLMRQPCTYNIGTLAPALGVTYDRARDALLDIEAEFGVTRDGQSQLITVILPGAPVIL